MSLLNLFVFQRRNNESSIIPCTYKTGRNKSYSSYILKNLVNRMFYKESASIHPLRHKTKPFQRHTLSRNLLNFSEGHNIFGRL